MSQYSLKLSDLKRGDLICPVGTKVKFIVSKNEEGKVYTIERRKDKKGPVLTQEGLTEYYKFNVGENDTDEFREKIISTYLERHKGSATSQSAYKRYIKKRQENANDMNRLTDLLKEFAEQEGVTVPEYILLAAEFYEKNKTR